MGIAGTIEFCRLPDLTEDWEELEVEATVEEEDSVELCRWTDDECLPTDEWEELAWEVLARDELECEDWPRGAGSLLDGFWACPRRCRFWGLVLETWKCWGWMELDLVRGKGGGWAGDPMLPFLGWVGDPVGLPWDEEGAEALSFIPTPRPIPLPLRPPFPFSFSPLAVT